MTGDQIVRVEYDWSGADLQPARKIVAGFAFAIRAGKVADVQIISKEKLIEAGKN